MEQTMTTEQFPEYLTTFDALQQHIRAQLDEASNTAAKGERFARFAQRLIPQTRIGSEFSTPVLNPKMSNDGGVDLIADSVDGNSKLYIQSKLWVDRAETIDNVLSKFQAYRTMDKRNNQPLLFDIEQQAAQYLLITLSPLSKIIERYEKTAFSSRGFYDACVQDGRIQFIDGNQILATLRATYNKLNQIPNNMILNFEGTYIREGNVYIGVISSDAIRDLYNNFGDALFFENVRDFLGIPRFSEKSGRTSPNNEIMKTLSQSPDKLLSRNNGLVFGAREVKLGDSSSQLILSDGSVVNGCQTTMCIVQYATKPCFVLAKVVETDDAWDITKSANYQTSVPDIDLEIARYLRPQLVKRAASVLGVQVQDRERSAFQLIDEIYYNKIAYDETRLLYIGLFSRSPNNVFASNYTELMPDLIRQLYKQPTYEEEIFDVLFSLQGASQKGMEDSRAVFTNPTYAKLFKRLFEDESLSYRSFLSILALCGALGVNISDRNSDINQEFVRTRDFLLKARSLLKLQPETFVRFYKLAVKTWMQETMTDDDDVELRRDMYIKSKRLNFTVMFRKLCMEADLDLSSVAKPAAE
jgi:hypothetical protein